MPAPKHTFKYNKDNRAKRMRELREKKSWTQKMVAKLCGVSIDTVSSWERGEGKSKLSDQSIARYHEKLGVSDDYFDKVTETVDTNDPQKEPKKETISDDFVTQDQENALVIEDLEDKIVSNFANLTLEEHKRKAEKEKKRRIDESWDWANLETVDIHDLKRIHDLFSNSFKYIAPLAGIERRIIFYSPNSNSYFSPGYESKDSVVRKITYDNEYKISSPIILGMIPYTDEQLDYRKMMFRDKELFKEYMLSGGVGLEEKYAVISCSEKEFEYLEEQFNNKINSDVYFPEGSNTKISIFPLAPQPLVVKLGFLFSNFSDIEVYQPHINNLSWEWDKNFTLDKYVNYLPPDKSGIKILTISLCSAISKDSVIKNFQQTTSVWQLCKISPGTDFLNSKKQITEFIKSFESILESMQIENDEKVYLFISVPIAIAFEIGRFWRQNYGNHELLLYGKAHDSEYSLLTTLKGEKEP